MIIFLIACLLFVWWVGGELLSSYYASTEFDSTTPRSKKIRVTAIIMTLWPFIGAVAITWAAIEGSFTAKRR
jgi:hypothetical protein